MSALPSILIFTYAEYGQANVNLAIAYELALAGVNVWMASFASFESRVSRLQELVARHASHASGKPTGSVRFCECKGFPSWSEALVKSGATNAPYGSHGMSGALESYPLVGLVSYPWGREEHCMGIGSCREVIATIKPNVVAVDSLFKIAQDACELAGQKFVIVSPNSVKTLAVAIQPHLTAFWKYPALSSGFSFPLKWWQIPLNIYLNIRHAIEIRTSRRINEIQSLRKSLGLKLMASDQLHYLYRGVTYICPALAETDLPYTVIPEQIRLCGPIIIPFDPLEECDPTLARWLDNGPTVMINLGTHVQSESSVAKEMASALRILLDFHDRKGACKIQVLWKTMSRGDTQTVIDDIIGKEIKEGRVKVVPWLEAEPISVLQHPNMVCTVHHGGANSFYEGVWSGIPHVILPVWYDTYDHATCAEYLDIGIYGNKTCAPGVGAEELGSALARVTGDTEEAAKFRRSAKRLKDVCRAKGSGRELAALAILQEAGIET